MKPLIIIFKGVSQTQVKNYGGLAVFLFLLPVLDRIQVSVVVPCVGSHSPAVKPLCHHCHDLLAAAAPAAPAGRMGQHIPGGTGRFPISGYLWIKSGHPLEEVIQPRPWCRGDELMGGLTW